jgi:ATP-dependent 26S proteasome regulatory subunit
MFAEDLKSYIKAGQPLIYVTALELPRAAMSIEEVCKSLNGEGYPFHEWKVTTGWDNSGSGDDPSEVFDWIDRFDDLSVCLLYNFHGFIGENPEMPTVQNFIDGYQRWKGRSPRTVIVLSPIYKVAPELERIFLPVPYELPTSDQIEKTVSRVTDGWIEQGMFKGWESEEEKQRVVSNAGGMTENEVENALALSLAKTKTVDPQIIMSEKAKILESAGVLEYTPFEGDMSSVGGLQLLKEWLIRRKKVIFNPKSKDFGIANPKGVFLLGPPGTGKSLTAKCIAQEFGLPLIKFDMSKVFSKFVGSSEERMRMVFNQIESLAPAVLWVDEIEKAMAGASGGGEMDSGVSKRVYGQMITWMEERPKDKLVYIVATANSIQGLPAPLLRRFDEVFWADLPTQANREEILEIHMSKRGKEMPSKTSVGKIVSLTQGFSGAEIEKVVDAALVDAFAESSENPVLEGKHLEAAASELVPQARLNREEIESSRTWSIGRCKQAQEGEPVRLDNINIDKMNLMASRRVNLN